jgi:hypothetical protein
MVLGLFPSVRFVSTNHDTKDLRDTPGGASIFIDVAIIHFADPPYFLPIQVV